jgi:hypothetical protein
LIAAVTGDLGPVITLAGFSRTDVTGGMKEPADKTFLAMGVPYGAIASTPAADGSETQAIAYLSYFTLEKAWAAVAAKADVTAGTAGIKGSQQYEHVKELLARWVTIAQQFGLEIPGADGGTGSGFVPIPYAGGVSQADYQTVAADADRMPPMFQPRYSVWVSPEVAT